MKKIVTTSTVAFCVLFSVCVAQTIRKPFAAPAFSLSAYSTLQSDAFSVLYNQAALAQIKKTTIGLYTEQRFLIAAIKLHMVSAAIPTTLGNFGIKLTYMGFKNYTENQFGIAYGRKLGSKLDVGIQFNYYGSKIPAYSSSAMVNADIGAILHLTNQLNVGLHLTNPVSARFSKTAESLPGVINIGFGYDVSEHFFFSAEMVKETGLPVSVNAGFQYTLSKLFYARAGVMSAAAVVYAACGIGSNKFRLYVNGSYHPRLGFSPGLTILFHK